MKIFILPLLILFTLKSQGQIENKLASEENRLNNDFAVQIGLQGSAFASLDDNFISQAYTQDIGLNLNAKFGIKELFGIGFNMNRYELSRRNSQFLGSRFPSSRYFSISTFLYYQQPLVKNLTGEVKFGFFQGDLLNRSASGSILGYDNLRLNYSGLMSGLNLIYYLGPKKRIGISLGSDIYYSLSNKIKTAPSESDFINKNLFTTINLGVVIGN